MAYSIKKFVLSISPESKKTFEENANLFQKYKDNAAILKSTEYKNNIFKKSGFDLYFPEIKGFDYKINPKEIKSFGLGIKVKLSELTTNQSMVPRAYYLYRNSSMINNGLIIENNVINSGFQEELKIAIYNVTDNPVIICPMESLVQICMPDLSTEFDVEINGI